MADGRIGRTRASATQYARAVMPGVLARLNVLDASEGANYSGGSAYAPGLPLLPSSVGLAGLEGLEGRRGRSRFFSPRARAGIKAWQMQQAAQRGLSSLPGVLPPKMNVIDPSGGANYTGGSDWVPGLPLTVSSAGLADTLIKGGYGRAGLGAAMIQGGYGRAGLGQTGSAADEDLAGVAEAIEVGRQLDPGDGRIGQTRVAVDEYGKAIMPGVLARSNVLDASEGANYSGGSAYAPGLPLLPSSVGLAGLDDLSDLQLGGRKMLRIMSASKIGRSALKNKKKAYIGFFKKARFARTPKDRAVAQTQAMLAANAIAQIRAARAQVLRAHGAVGANFGMRAPLWTR